MNINLSFGSLKKAFIAFLHRFHVVIFVVVVLGGLAVVVFMLNSTIILSSDPGDYTPNANNASFDQATIQRVEELKTRDQTTSQLDLSGRSNPFVE